LDLESATYDEFGMLEVYAEYEGITLRNRPAVSRQTFELPSGQKLSGIVWGVGQPELVFLHGGGQNAHTWDSVGLHLDRPMLAIDLPGHGHSDWRADRDYSPRANAVAVSAMIKELAPSALAVIGMSLGGLTLMHLAAEHPDQVRKAVIVDVTPNVLRRTADMTARELGATSLVAGPQTFHSFDALVDATARTLPARSIESLRVAVRHNSVQDADGRWRWRYDRLDRCVPADYGALWADLGRIRVPILLVRGGASGFVSQEDADALIALQPTAQVEVVAGAGHSVQSDRARDLSRLIEAFV